MNPGMNLPKPLHVIDAGAILKLIPHRHPFIWIDAVDILETGRWARGKKAVSYSEPVFQGHFPNAPIFPGVLIAEALAQTGAVLLNHAVHLETSKKGNDPLGMSNDCGYLLRVDIKFLKPVLPGTLLELEVKKGSQVQNMFSLNCSAEVAGEVVASGRISVSHPAGDLRS